MEVIVEGDQGQHVKGKYNLPISSGGWSKGMTLGDAEETYVRPADAGLAGHVNRKARSQGRMRGAKREGKMKDGEGKEEPTFSPRAK